MANNTLIGALRAEATLESGKFVDGARKIRTEAKKTEVQLKQSFGTMGTAVKGFGTALTAGLSIGLLSATIKKSLDYASSLKTISQQAGVTTKDLQTLRYAATQNGLTVAQFDNGLTKLKETMGKVAAGASAPTKAFAALGISAKQLSALDPAQTFKLVADKLATIPDPAKRAAFELALFGEAGSKLDPLLAKGSGAMNELAKAAQELGIVLSDRQIQNADETAAKLDQVKMVLAAQISGVVADNAASIVTLANALAQLTSSILNFLGSNPTAALAILGALAGGRVGGLPGAAIGGFAGAVAGSELGRSAALNNSDLKFRKQRLGEARRAYREAKQTGVVGLVEASERRLREETAATNRALAAYNSPKAAASGGNIPQFLAPKGGGGRKRGGGKGPRDRSDEATYQINREIMRADMDILRAKQALAHDYVEQTALSIQMLDLEKQMFDAEMAHKLEKAKQDLAEGRITKAAYDEVAASVETLKAKYAIEDQLKRQAILEEEETKRQADYNALDDKDFEIQRDIMQKRASLAETAAERRQVELDLLRLEYEHKRMVLERIMRESQDWREIEEARRDLANLDANYNLDRQGVMNSTRGPWEDYIASLPTTAAKANEALERLQVQGMEGLTDAALKLVDGLDDAGKALLQTLKTFFLGIARMELQKGIGSLFGNQAPLSGIFGGGGIFGSGSTGTGGMSLGSVGVGASAIGSAIPKSANGNSFRIGGLAGIDKNLLSLNGMPMSWVSLGERIDVVNDNGPRGGASGRPLVQNFNFPNSDFNSFRRSQTQTARLARRGLDRA